MKMKVKHVNCILIYNNNKTGNKLSENNRVSRSRMTLGHKGFFFCFQYNMVSVAWWGGGPGRHRRRAPTLYSAMPAVKPKYSKNNQGRNTFQYSIPWEKKNKSGCRETSIKLKYVEIEIKIPLYKQDW